MVHHHGLGTTLGLGALAGVIDDERVEMGQGAENGLGVTRTIKGQRFSGEPFQIAMFAEMNHGVGAEGLPYPSVKGNISMRRHEVRVVIAGDGINVVAPRRLDAEGDMAKPLKGQMEMTIVEERVVFGRPPAVHNLCLQGVWQRVKEAIIGFSRECLTTPLFFSRIGRPRPEACHHRIAGGGEAIG